MRFDKTHGKVLVAIIAMLTLSALLLQCAIDADCSRLQPEVIVVLLAIIGSTLGVDILGAGADQGGD